MSSLLLGEATTMEYNLIRERHARRGAQGVAVQKKRVEPWQGIID